MNNERQCRKCGNEKGLGMYSLVSDLCDDCYERENYPDIHHTMIVEEQDFYLPDGEYNLLDLFVFLSDCNSQLHKKVKSIGKENNNFFACLLYEAKEDEKLKELMRNKHVNIKYSYFFTNDKYDLIPNFEDRNKNKHWIICNG